MKVAIRFVCLHGIKFLKIFRSEFLKLSKIEEIYQVVSPSMENGLIGDEN